MATNAYGTTLKFTPSGGTQVTVGKLTAIGNLVEGPYDDGSANQYGPGVYVPSGSSLL